MLCSLSLGGVERPILALHRAAEHRAVNQRRSYAVLPRGELKRNTGDLKERLDLEPRFGVWQNVKVNNNG